jgi:regulator of nucleoside diphosphate kinase
MSLLEVIGQPVVATAAITALAEARWETSELLSRRSPEAVAELLRGHAAELACSPLGCDQLLSVALEAAARDLSAGRPALNTGILFFAEQPEPADGDRLKVREGVFRQGGVSVDVATSAARELERRHRLQADNEGDLSQRLAADARLHQTLWDDSRLPADHRTRFAMLCSIPKLLDRAEALEPSRLRLTQRRPPIAISPRDHAHLQCLAMTSLLDAPRTAGPLLDEVDRADIVDEVALSSDVVRIGSWVEFADDLTGEVREVRLVTPPVPDDAAGEISVLSSVGAALIGLTAGQSILWSDRVGSERIITVLRVRRDLDGSPT